MEFVNAVKHLADQYSIELQIDESAGQSKDLITQLFDIHAQTTLPLVLLSYRCLQCNTMRTAVNMLANGIMNVSLIHYVHVIECTLGHTGSHWVTLSHTGSHCKHL